MLVEIVYESIKEGKWNEADQEEEKEANDIDEVDVGEIVHQCHV